MSVTEALDAAGIAYVLHVHPPIRGEADLHLTRLDWETSVRRSRSSCRTVGWPSWRSRARRGSSTEPSLERSACRDPRFGRPPSIGWSRWGWNPEA